jgi:2-succinyl-5-enolpyruvyl-6-hydroxy-3-cyclohexene-1-carboxylate synthase
MSADANLNALWCRALAEELVRAGTAHAVLCPGSRNSPLLFALADAFGERAISHVDERSAAFIALGMVRASGRPAVVCVTSGTAVANCLPAVCEAHAMGLPLLVIGADRPWEAQERSAPQTMAQRGLFGAFADELALGEPIAEETALLALRGRISRAAQRRGPTFINCPLRDPLPPIANGWTAPELSSLALHGRERRPFTVVGPAAGWPPPAALDWYGEGLRGMDFLRPGLRGLIIAGCGSGGHPALAAELAAITGFPLLADAASGLRGPDCPHVVGSHDALLAGAMAGAAPELIIQLGPAPLTRTAYEWLGRQTCPLLLLEDGHDRDFLGRAWVAIEHASPGTWRAIGSACAPGDDAWRESWLAADREALRRLQAALADEPWGESVAAHGAVNHAGFASLHLASSMAIRHANLHLLARPHLASVHANRGVNGIDGTIATFIGEQVAGGGGLLLIGDLATLHDLPALAAAHRLRACAVVVLNNDGGGIFDYLAVAQVPGYERLVRTPHGLGFAQVAAQFGLAYRRVADAAALAAALDEAQDADGCLLVECALAGLDAVAQHRRVLRAAAGTV